MFLNSGVMPMTEAVSMNRKHYARATLSPDLLISIAGHITSHRRIGFDELKEEFGSFPEYSIEEALNLLEDPKFFGVNTDPVIKRGDNIIEMVGDNKDVAFILHVYRNDIYENTTTYYIPF